MITVFPMKNNEISKFTKKEIIAHDADVLLAKDKDTVLGYIAILQKDIYFDILDINIEKNTKTNTAQLLLKSAASYALNRNIFTLSCENASLFPVLLKNKGREISGKVYIDIPKLLSCDCSTTCLEN